ncbi:MAG TPA: hypothetical protein VD741_02165, partial [Solirubrobacterales bacterium]|nr:hypothetical protein [Solirubrobacterales bacterium]
MNSRVALLVLVAFLLGLAGPAGAATPEGPRLAILASNGQTSGVITTGPSGEGREVLVDDPDYWGIGDRLSWSADGERLAFVAAGLFQSDPGGPFGTGWPLVAVAGAGGGSRVFPRAFLNGGEPVMAPDGGSVA